MRFRIGVGLGLILSGVTSAQNLGTDCSRVSDVIDSEGEIIESMLTRAEGVDEGLYPSQAAMTAVRHLQAACCQADVLPRSQCPSSLPELFAPVQTLYGQVVDIGLRRMDGYAEAIYGYDELIDPVALARRTQINQLGADPSGVPPGRILSVFDQVVTPSTQDVIAPVQPIRGGDASLIECSDIQSYQSLQYRIQQQCAIAYCVTSALQASAQLAGNALSQQGLQVQYHQCGELVHKRILDEYTTTSTIMQAQANLLSRRAQEEYLQTYMVDTKMTTLGEKITKMVGLLEIINVKYTQGTKMCN